MNGLTKSIADNSVESRIKYPMIATSIIFLTATLTM